MSVIALNDKSTLANPHEPDEALIKRLEEILELVRSGQVIGVAVTLNYFDGKGGSQYFGRCSRNTVGQLFAVATRLSLAIDNEP